MDIDQFFRLFHSPFGFPREESDIPHKDENGEPCNCNENYPPQFPNSPDEMFQQMEDMFNSIFRSSFSVLDVSRENRPEIRPVEINPRSFMLKESSEKNSCEDSQCTSSECLLKNSEAEVPPFKTFTSSFYSKKVWLPDGKVEEYETLVDENGKKTTKVKRTIQDSTYEAITKTNELGVSEQEEHFINLDENKLPEFEKTWNSYRTNDETSSGALSAETVNSKPFYLSFLKRIFGS